MNSDQANSLSSGGGTFLERCADLGQKLGRVRSSETDNELVRQIEGLRSTLAPLKQRSALLLQSLEALQEVGEIKAGVLIGEPAVKPLQVKIAALIKILQENRSKLKKNDVFAECVQRAHAVGNDLDKKLKTTWSGQIERDMPGYTMFLAFEGLPQCAAALAELKQLGGELQALAKQLPSKESLLELQQKSIRMQELIDGLGIKDEPPEMILFLKRCAQGGVPLDELTPEIFEWLKAKGFSPNLRVCSGNAR